MDLDLLSLFFFLLFTYLLTYLLTYLVVADLSVVASRPCNVLSDDVIFAWCLQTTEWPRKGANTI